MKPTNATLEPQLVLQWVSDRREIPCSADGHFVQRLSSYRPAKYEGNGRLRIVCKPGGAARTLGIEFTTMEAVEMSPGTPPGILILSFGLPSITVESYGSGAPRYASMCSVITAVPCR